MARTVRLRDAAAALIARVLTSALVAGCLAAAPAAATAAEPRPWLSEVSAVDRRDADVVYLAGITHPAQGPTRGAIWRSDDAGASFHPVRVGPRLSFDSEGGVAVAAADDGALLAGIADAPLAGSADGGATWAELDALGQILDVEVGPGLAPAAFAIVGRDDERTTMGRARASSPFRCLVRDEGDSARTGLYRQAPGEAWRRVIDDDVQEVLPHPALARRVYAVGLCAVYRSDDGGRTFAARRAGGPTSLVVHPAEPDQLLALADFQLVRSADGGRSWLAVADAPLLQAIAPPNAATPERIVGAVLVEDEIGLQRLVVSDDFGRSWRTLGSTHHAQIGTLTGAAADPGRLYASTGFSVLASRDGGATWTAHGRPLDGVGPDVALADAQLVVQRVLGGRRPPRARVGLTLGADELGSATGRLRLAVREDGRARSLGAATFTLGPRHAATASVELTRGTARAVRAAGRVEAWLRIEATDDLGDVTVRWERVVLTG